LRRSRYGRINGALWKRQPVAIAVSSTPRPFQSVRSSSSSTRTVSAFSSSLKSRRNSATDNGCSDVSRAASRTTLASCVFIVSSEECSGGVRNADMAECRAMAQ
jgi:hypothetical protein